MSSPPAGTPRPRNLSARAAHRVVGNPTSVSGEAGVANCFPGLEWDVRELDRRFFPGLVFQFVTTPLRPQAGLPTGQQGARLAYVDSLQDPDLPLQGGEEWQEELRAALAMGIVSSTPLQSGTWHLESFSQHGKTFAMRDGTGTPYDGELVWRMVRGILPDEPLTITLQQRDDVGAVIGDLVVLEGRRRRYTDERGGLSEVYRAGELTMSMCNPWSHDFRDCACHYWASNHPDVVLGPTDDLLEDGQPADPDTADARLDWIRADRSGAGDVAAAATILENRPHQMDHFEMNERWRDLPFVLEGREIGATYSPPEEAAAEPYGSLDELIEVMTIDLAPMELTLAVQYLYAYFSVRAPDEVDVVTWPDLAGDVAAIRAQILIVAVGEMHHLRWANRLLWELLPIASGRTYEPVLSHVATLPILGGRRSSLEPLTPDTVSAFIEIERPGGTIDTAYARTVATLQTSDHLPPHLAELAMRIDADGNEHFLKFSEIGRIIARYPSGTGAPWLRQVAVADPGEAEDALEIYRQILRALTSAYSDESRNAAADGQLEIDRGREAMDALRAAGESLARSGKGIPFFAA